MAINSTAEWRIRVGGNNLNGAAYDSAQSGVISTTLNGAITNSATSITVASATGWPSSGNYYARIGPVGAEGTDGLNEVVLVTGGQGTTTWTVTRGQLGTTGTAFASGVVVDNNLARCDTAAFSGTDGTSNASTTFTSASATFNATVVGNHLRLASGTNGTVGYYRVTGFTDANTITLDRNCSTASMTNGAWKIGGAGASFSCAAIQASNSTGNKMAVGCICYVRGSGSNDPVSADYAWGNFSSSWGSTLSRGIAIFGEFGRPKLSQGSGTNAQSVTIQNISLQNFVVIQNGTGDISGISINSSGRNVFFNCKFDGNSKNPQMLYLNSSDHVVWCEFIGWPTSQTTNSGSAAIFVNGSQCVIYGCSFRNFRGTAINTASNVGGIVAIANVIVGNASMGIRTGSDNVNGLTVISNNVISGSSVAAAHGIQMLGNYSAAFLSIMNNVITNCTGTGSYAIAAADTNFSQFSRVVQNNAFYNNTANYDPNITSTWNASTKATDVVCTADPFTNAAGGDYTLNNTAGGGKELRDGGLPGQLPGLSTTDVYSQIGLLGTPPAFIAPSGLIARNIGTY